MILKTAFSFTSANIIYVFLSGLKSRNFKTIEGLINNSGIFIVRFPIVI